ncbi:MAG: uroporphyrinogen decarboxylase family protein [Promethearchaeota archaeon]
MNAKERVLTSLDHEEPDRVPIYTSLIDSSDVLQGYGFDDSVRLTQGSAVEQLKSASKLPGWRKIVKSTVNRRSTLETGAKKSVELFKKIGTDLVTLPIMAFPIGKSAGFGISKPGINTPDYSNYADEFGRIFHLYYDKESGLGLVNYVGGMFDSTTGDLEEIISKYDKWAPLDPTIKTRYFHYEAGVKHSKEIDGPYVIPGLGGLMEVAWQAFGFENYSRLLFEYPDFIERLTNDREEFSKGLLEILIDKYNIEVAFVWDDLGYKTGTFISPRLYKKLVYPRMKNLVDYCHKNGVKLIHHTCGNINGILSEVINTGIDGLNPLEPAASMDPFQIKRDYRDKITIVGNVDTIHLLAKGTPEEVKAYVKKLIKCCAPGGGLIVASGHSINPAVPFENYKAMIDAVYKYGTYPIEIDD